MRLGVERSKKILSVYKSATRWPGRETGWDGMNCSQTVGADNHERGLSVGKCLARCRGGVFRIAEGSQCSVQDQ